MVSLTAFHASKSLPSQTTRFGPTAPITNDLLTLLSTLSLVHRTLRTEQHTYHATYSLKDPSSEHEMRMTFAGWGGLLSHVALLGSVVGHVSAQHFIGGSMSVEQPGFGPECVAALNSSIACPAFLLDWSAPQATPSFNNLEALCSDECLKSLKDAQAYIEGNCTAESEVMVSDGNTYPATWIIDRSLYTFSTSCLRTS